MVSDTDYSIIMTKLEAILYRLEKIEAKLWPSNPNVGYTGCSKCGTYTCNGFSCTYSEYPKTIGPTPLPQLSESDLKITNDYIASIKVPQTLCAGPEHGDASVEAKPFINIDDVLRSI